MELGLPILIQKKSSAQIDEGLLITIKMVTASDDTKETVVAHRTSHVAGKQGRSGLIDPFVFLLVIPQKRKVYIQTPQHVPHIELLLISKPKAVRPSSIRSKTHRFILLVRFPLGLVASLDPFQVGLDILRVLLIGLLI